MVLRLVTLNDLQTRRAGLSASAELFVLFDFIICISVRRTLLRFTSIHSTIRREAGNAAIRGHAASDCNRCQVQEATSETALDFTRTECIRSDWNERPRRFARLFINNDRHYSTHACPRRKHFTAAARDVTSKLLRVNTIKSQCRLLPNLCTCTSR